MMAANSLDSDSEKNDFVVAGASIRTSLYSLTLISIFFLSSAARKDDSPKVFASGFTPVFLACPPRVALRCFLTTLAPFASFFAFGELGLWLAMMRDTSAAKSFSLSSSSPESSSAAFWPSTSAPPAPFPTPGSSKSKPSSKNFRMSCRSCVSSDVKKREEGWLPVEPRSSLGLNLLSFSFVPGGVCCRLPPLLFIQGEAWFGMEDWNSPSSSLISFGAVVFLKKNPFGVPAGPLLFLNGPLISYR
mmetsp:Transcript_28809/g.63101  ORF Transcript_28809/g.63101 Transcript_28809/m.63101 type:complete len:246 (-) Transcript_28809:462-1199(-)